MIRFAWMAFNICMMNFTLHSADHKPQDNIEITCVDKNDCNNNLHSDSFDENDLLNIYSGNSRHMLVRAHETTSNTAN